MKKNVLALSMSAAILSFGFAGAAYAITDLPNGGTGQQLVANPNGVGQMLLVPYFTAQDKNATLLNLVNTDTVNGKIVKVRFRGAANSDDLYDFLVFMSPGDVWSANVSKNSAGLAALTTADNSCTKPAKSVINGAFKTSRLDSSLSAELKAGGTREGYVEMFAVADVPKSATGRPDNISADGSAEADGINDLYNIIKHNSSGTALCAGSTWSAIDKNLTSAEYRALGMANPTTGLTASWTIINVDGAAAWAANATAIHSASFDGTSQAGNLVYWPQVGTSVSEEIRNYTTDPLFYASTGIDSTGTQFTASKAVTATWVDLPDMSTPYFAPGAVYNSNTGNPPASQAFNLTRSIAATDVMNEFLTDVNVQGSTDWVFTMPTRRYLVALDYASIGKTLSVTTTDTGKRFAPQLYNFWFSHSNTSVQTLNGYREICVSGIEYTPYNREEGKITSSAEVVVSPAEPQPGLSFCGEAAVLSFNNGGAATTATLKANVAAKDIDVTYTAGWMQLEMKNSGLGLPVLGGSFTRAAAGSSLFGGNWDHRFVPSVITPNVQ